MWISRRVYNDLMDQHKRQIETMAAWIEQLHVERGIPTAPVAAPMMASGSGPAPHMAMYMGDDESDLRDAHQEGLINDEQLEEGLRQIGFLNQEVVAS